MMQRCRSKRSMYNIPGIAGITGLIILSVNLSIFSRWYINYWNIISPVISPVALGQNWAWFITHREFVDTGDNLRTSLLHYIL